MKLKYYLRGLGIGIIITVIILAITSNGKTETLTDDEIIQRAEQLGMVMKDEEGSSVLEDDTQDVGDTDSQSEEETDAENQPADEITDSESQQDEETTNTENQKDEETTDTESQQDEEITDTESQQDEEITDTESQQDEETTDTESQSGEETTDTENALEEVKYVRVAIEPGDPCYTVAEKMYAAGLVDNVDNFNAFLKAKGIDRVLRVGVYNIPEGVTYEELAKIFTEKPKY